MPKNYAQDIIDKAHQRYLEGKSLQAIANELLPTAKNGRITVHRWVEKFDWKDDLAELERQKKQQFDEDFASVAVQLAKDHLALARKVRRAIDLTLDQYFVTDPLTGTVSIRLHPKYGTPLIPAMALASLIEKATDLERRALGMENVIPQDTLERVAGRPVEVAQVDPLLLKQFGDWAAVHPSGEDDERGFVRLDRQADAVGGPATLAVPEGDHPVSGPNDVHVTLEPDSGVIDAVDLPAGKVDVYTQPTLFGGELGSLVHPSSPTADDDGSLGQ